MKKINVKKTNLVFDFYGKDVIEYIIYKDVHEARRRPIYHREIDSLLYL